MSDNDYLHRNIYIYIYIYEKSESVGDNFGKFIHQFQPETKTLIWKLENILIKFSRQKCVFYYQSNMLKSKTAA